MRDFDETKRREITIYLRGGKEPVNSLLHEGDANHLPRESRKVELTTKEQKQCLRESCSSFMEALAI